MFEPWAPINGYDVSTTGGVDPFGGSAPQMPGAGGGMPGMGGLLSALQGVKAPAAPEAQRVSTPGAPMITAPAPRAPTPVKGDQFMQLLQMLGNGPAAAAPQTPTVQPRLAQALGMR